MIKRPASVKDWKTDQGRSGEQQSMDRELSNAIEQSINSLEKKLNTLIKRREKQIDQNA